MLLTNCNIGIQWWFLKALLNYVKYINAYLFIFINKNGPFHVVKENSSLFTSVIVITVSLHFVK